MYAAGEEWTRRPTRHRLTACHRMASTRRQIAVDKQALAKFVEKNTESIVQKIADERKRSIEERKKVAEKKKKKDQDAAAADVLARAGGEWRVGIHRPSRAFRYDAYVTPVLQNGRELPAGRWLVRCADSNRCRSSAAAMAITMPVLRL